MPSSLHVARAQRAARPGKSHDQQGQTQHAEHERQAHRFFLKCLFDARKHGKVLNVTSALRLRRRTK